MDGNGVKRRPAITTQGAGPDGYGEHFAEVYDDWYGEITDAIGTARFVAQRCNDLPVLELGVGTGRLAEPLCEAGVSVIGIDASAAMLARCSARRLGPSLSLVQADLAALSLSGRFGAALIAFNTLFNLPSAAEQQRLFSQLRPLLEPDGIVIVEALDPAALAGAPARSIGPGPETADGLTVVATVIDEEAQTISGQHLALGPTGVQFRPWHLRWSTPAQIDGYATAAGFARTERYADWSLSPHSPSSEVHISCYRPT